MDHLLKFLIYEINTINGKRDSSLELQRIMIQKKIGSKSNLSAWKYQQTEQIVKH
jgi:hypothetical protein